MKSRTLKITLPLIIVSSVLIGCGGKTEDVRISLCRDLSTSLLDLQQPPEWLDLDTHIKRPAYARISLEFKARKTSGSAYYKAACYFEYDTVHENAITHVDPLSAYSTLPYKMTLNGKNVPKRVIHDAVNSIVKKKGKALLDKARKEFRRVMKSV